MGEKKELRAVQLLQVFSWIANITGILLIIFNAADFTTENMNLMVGMGFLIAGMGIFFIMSSVFQLLHVNNRERL